MPNDCVSYQDSGYFSPLINDYLNQKPNLQSLYNRFPALENFGAQIAEKQQNFNDSQRKTLVDVLIKQYESLVVSDKTKSNITALERQKTFTVTTGHQLNLFTGPLYFLYKIVSAINLSKKLKTEYPEYDFIPVYWMATEDHDFEEINYFNFHGKKFRWNRESAGPVGQLSTDGLDEVLEVFALEAGPGQNAAYLKDLFREAYLEHTTLSGATRYLANALFGAHGLVILDANDADLKRDFIPYIREELLQQTAFKKVSETIRQLADYTIQVNPREINLFYIGDGLRERIIFLDEIYQVKNTAIKFTESQILDELEKRPHNFSPNVILRPLYQEVILPNLCYIGGGGELAYWLELKAMFESYKITFPILMLRNSVLLVNEKQTKKADKLNLSWSDLFLKQNALLRKKTHELSEFPISMEPLKQQLERQFKTLFELVDQTDASFSGAVKAQQAKQIKGLENLEKRLLKAQRLKYASELERITLLQDELFPHGSLQERVENFSGFGKNASPQSLIEQLLQQLDPLQLNFSIVEV